MLNCLNSPAAPKLLSEGGRSPPMKIEPSVSTPSTSHKNNLMRAARWRMAAEIFAGMEFKMEKFNAVTPNSLSRDCV